MMRRNNGVSQDQDKKGAAPATPEKEMSPYHSRSSSRGVTKTRSTTTSRMKKNAPVVGVLCIILFVVVSCYIASSIMQQQQHHHETHFLEELRGYREQYVPSSSEQYIMDHAEELGYGTSDYKQAPKGCLIWKDPSLSTPKVHKALTDYSVEVVKHTKIIADFEPIPDLLKSIIETGSHDVCATARPHPDGLKALFPSNQLSLTNSGYVEPLAPPLRTMDLCKDVKPSTDEIMKLDYLVHDFEAMCHKLKPNSKRILIDMGASLVFKKGSTPMLELMDLYEKFGFNFDHIYAFELKYTDPKKVYQNLLPEKYIPAFHWMNVGEC